jgi:hypothetical protein
MKGRKMSRRMTGFGTVGGSLVEEAPGGSTDGRASRGGRLRASRESVGYFDFRIPKAHPDGGDLNVFLGGHSAEGARAPEAPNAVRTAPTRSRSRTRYAFPLIARRFTSRVIPPAGAAAVACRRTESSCRRRRLWIWMPPLRYARMGNREFPENRKKQKRGTAHGKTRQYTA